MDDFDDPIEEIPENQGLREQAGNEEERELKEAEDKVNQLAQQGAKKGKNTYKAVKKTKKGAKAARTGGGAPAEGTEAVAAEQGAEIAGEAAAEGAAAAAEGLGAAVVEGGAAAGVETAAGGAAVGAVGAEAAGGVAAGIAAGGWIVVVIILIILCAVIIISVLLTGSAAGSSCTGGVFGDSSTANIAQPVTLTASNCTSGSVYKWAEDPSTPIGGTFSPPDASVATYTPPAVTKDTPVEIDVSVCDSSNNCNTYYIYITITVNAQGNSNTALYWAQKISNEKLTQSGCTTGIWYNRTEDYAPFRNNGYSSRVESGTCGVGGNTYFCTYLVTDAYRLAGYSNYPNSGNVYGHITAIDRLSGYTLVMANDLHNVKPGDAVYWLYTQISAMSQMGSCPGPACEAQHIDIVNTISLDSNGNGKMVTLDANSNTKSVTFTVANYRITTFKFGHYSGRTFVCDLCGVWFGEKN